MRLNGRTAIFIPDEGGTPVAYALKALRKDWHKVFGAEICQAPEPGANQIRLQFAHDLREDGFRVSHGAGDEHLLIEGADDLGLVFGIYHVCEHLLGVDPFEFWTDFVCKRRDSVTVSPFAYTAPRPKIRWRGWFINDEDCLRAWDDSLRMTTALYEQINETSLRAGWNMIIPISRCVADAEAVKLASEMGLWATQHHAAPLGAHSLSQRFPGVRARMPEERDRFITLYKEAIEQSRGRKVIWTVGFRGQGDRAFFDPEDDDRYNQMSAQGKIITEMIQLQQALVREIVPGPQIFAHNLYAESIELYRAGYLKLDDDVIRVWDDNGFGAMRRRRTIYQPERDMIALPTGDDRQRSNGIYYHVSFHDIRISSTLLPLVDPDLIQEAFQGAYDAGNMDYMLLNVSNVHPHVFDTDLVGKIATVPYETERLPADMVSEHYRAFNGKHFPGHEDAVEGLMRRYYQAPFIYGRYKDDRAGIQVYHFGLRHLILGVLNDEPMADRFMYAVGAPKDNEGIAQWHIERAGASLPDWESLHHDVHAQYERMSGPRAQYFHDTVLAHTDCSYFSCQGFVIGLDGVLAYREGDYARAFKLFTESKGWMKRAWAVIKSCEHDKWVHFFRGEERTSIRDTIRYLDTMQNLCRMKQYQDYHRVRWAVPHLGPVSGRHYLMGDVNSDELGRAMIAWERDGVDDLKLDE